MTDPHTLPPLSFAPLEGITGWIFRQVHHAMFPGLSRYYTPFFAPTADSPLTGRGLRDMHPDHNRGVPVVPQLLTNRAEDFIASARLLQDLGYKEAVSYTHLDVYKRQTFLRATPFGCAA